MRKIIAYIAIGLILILAAFAMGMCTSMFHFKGLSSGEIGIIKVEGTIVTADDIVEDLEDARTDSSLKAVVLRIDSPGGAVGASQEIFEEVKRLNAEKPVIVSMGDVAASGGYYIACGGRRLFANAGTITGSIGVRMEHVNLKDLLSWAKVNHQTLKSGRYKDIGTFDREMTQEEREILEKLLSDIHAQFKTDVSKARNIAAEKVEEIADGRVYTGEEALRLGLIDEIGGMPVAVKFAAESVGVKGEPKTRRIGERRPWWVRLLAEEAASFINKLVDGSALFKF